MKQIFILLSTFIVTSCLAQKGSVQVLTGAESTEKYLNDLKDKKIALVVNQTSKIKEEHLLDFLLANKINVVRLFSPEHGIRGDADAGEKVGNEKDAKTGIPIISLYGDNKKPKKEQLSGIEVVVFDMQDVGARFYTYLSTLHYVMEACAEIKIKLIVLDRPNPNGDYVDGPVLEPAFKSFVGIHPIPIVHGMTLGELAQMINAEKWLKDSVQCDLKVINCSNYDHTTSFTPPVKPSPNLPNLHSIRLYPTLCLFEGTVVSVGRGTNLPFQIIGIPDSISNSGFSFTPRSIAGMAKKPLYEGKRCVGERLDSNSIDKKIDLSYLIKYYTIYQNKEKYFNNFFNKLAGNATLQDQIKKGLSSDEIRKSWQNDLEGFKKKRKKYLLYPDFE
jgi:uncharacterized protein YbbC (DUF1343 family)